MIKIENTSRRTGNRVIALLYADTKAEVTDNLVLGDNVIDSASKVYTPNLDIGIMNSDGTWTWS